MISDKGQRTVKQFHKSSRMLLMQLLVTMATVTSATSDRCQCFCCGPLCKKVLFYLMFIITVCSAINNTNEIQELCNGNAISPRSAYFLEGEDIVLSCTTPDIPAESLTFVRAGDLEAITEEYIHILNETSIKMIIPNITAQDIDATKSSTRYKCANKSNISECYDNVSVRLEYYPREPVDLDCRIYDFNEMTCTWSLGVNYHRPHDVAVTCEITNFSFKSDNPRASWAQCPEQNRTACHWNSSNYLAPYMFWTKVSVTAKERNITEEIRKTFFQHDIMEPGSVEELSVYRAQGDRCVQLNWKPSHRSAYYPFRFNVSYSSSCTQDQSTMVYYDGNRLDNKKLDDNRILCDMSPYTQYTYTVSGQLMIKKELDNQTLIPKGYWSNPVIITERTNSDVLDVSPTLTSGLYDISSTTRPRYDSLKLYWTPLTDCDLHDAADNVKYRVIANNVTRQVKHPNFMSMIDIPKSTTLDVSLQSVNSVGPGPSPSVITVYPSHIGLQPSQLVIEYNKTDDDCVILAEIIVSENQPDISDVFHTLVWCKGTLECQEPVTWKRLSNNVTFYTFDGNLCDVDHRYGLVTHGNQRGQGQVVDTGIHWDPCIYQTGKVAEIPLSDVHLTKIQPENGFSVEWNHYNCEDVKVYISHYMVTYCIGEGTEICKCTEDEVNVNISRQNSSYIASDLNAGSQYCVWVRGVSKAGMGPANLKPLSHKVSAKTESSSVMVVIVILVVILGIFLAAILIGFAWKKLKAWRKRNPITVPGHDADGQGLLDVTSFSEPQTLNTSHIQGDIGDSVEGAQDRKYSIGDILAVLGNDDNLTGLYNDPEKIDDYMLSEPDSSQVPGDDDDVCDQNAPLLKSGEHVRVNPPGTKITHINELGDDQIVVNGRADRDHYKSISSVLSDAHSEQIGLSVEDLHSNRNSKDIDAIKNMNRKEVDEITDLKGEKGNHSINHNREEERESDGNDNERESDGNDNEQSMTKNIYLVQDNSQLKTADVEKSKTEKNIGVDIDEIEPNACDVDFDDGVWDSGSFNDFDNQFDNHYKQNSDLNSKDSYELSDDDELHKKDNVDTINVDNTDTVDDNDAYDHCNERADKGEDFFSMNGNVENDITNNGDKKFDENVSSKQSKIDNLTGEDQKRNKVAGNILSNNSNGLISKDSNIFKDKHVTSGRTNGSSGIQSGTSMDNSGTLQSYVMAGNTSSGHPIQNNSDHSSNSDEIKIKTQNMNGNVDMKEQMFHTYNEQECR